MTYIDPHRKLMHHIERIAQIRKGEQPAPVNVEIDLTNRCNLGCAGCHFAHTHSRGPLAGSAKPAGMLDVGDQMDTALAQWIIDDLCANGVQSITWTGGGEPTLHPAFDEIMQYAAGRIDNGIYTNGTLVNANRAAILKRGMKWVYVSLDESDAYSYKLRKRTDGFDKAIAGIQNLVEAEGDATIGVGFLIDLENVHRIDDMVELGAYLQCDYIQFRPLIEFAPDNPGKPIIAYGWIEEAIERLDRVSGAGIEVDISRFEMLRRWQGHGYPVCYWTQLQTVITPNGRVWTCVNRRGFQGDEIGDMSREPFYDIWQRSSPYMVNHNCRVLCRGHIPNQTLTHMMDGAGDRHRSFI